MLWRHPHGEFDFDISFLCATFFSEKKVATLPSTVATSVVLVGQPAKKRGARQNAERAGAGMADLRTLRNPHTR